MNKTKKTTSQDLLYQQAVQEFGRELARFVAGYERENGKRQELLQEVHFSLWGRLRKRKIKHVKPCATV
jgi:RNA polymerase sigma-70 factor (ECF subfamily)